MPGTRFTYNSCSISCGWASNVKTPSKRHNQKLIRKTLLVHLSKRDEVKQIYLHHDHTVLSIRYPLFLSIPNINYIHTQSSPMRVAVAVAK